MHRDKPGNLAPEVGAALVGRPEMNSGIDAGVDHFADAFAEGGPMALETRIGGARGGKHHPGVVIEEQPENSGHRTTHGRVPGNILGEVRRGHKRCPGWISLRSGIVILVGAADRRHRTPEVERILRVPTGDPRVGAGDVHQRESPSGLRLVEAASERDLTEHGVPNQRRRQMTVATNTGPSRAWRAPNHPQVALITMAALDDLAAELKMDALDFFIKNIEMTGVRANVYRDELLKGAELIEWKKNWHPRGQGTGTVRKGLGLSIHTWGGTPHASDCDVTIQPDGSVEVKLGTQDLGTGTRTVLNIIAAETFGLPLDAVKVMIGDNRYSPSGSSGGSTTVGGISSSSRRASVDALNQLLEKVAPTLQAKPEELEAVGGKIQVAANPAKSVTWKQACASLGSQPITARGKQPGQGTLATGGVGGIQMAQVSVDMETGIVKMDKIVAVQDCGLVIDLKTAESQVYGAMIMGTCYALYEERIMDGATGKVLNPNMEFYKLAGIGDIGQMQVHMMTGPGHDERGVIGLGEPPTISPGAAIANAVANAIGVRVPTIPMTPDKVLAALAGKGGANARV